MSNTKIWSLFALGLLTAAIGNNNAATIPWDGPTTGTAMWGDAVNWVGDVVPGTTDTALLNTPNSTITISLDASRFLHQITFSGANAASTLGSASDISGGFELTVNNIRRDNAGSVQKIATNVNLNATDSIWDISQGFNSHLLVTGSIIGSGKNLLKYGNGTLMLGGANTYTGDTKIHAGTINLNFSDAAAPSSNIINAASDLVAGNGTLSLTGKGGNLASQTFASTSLLSGNTSFSITNGNTANTRTALDLGSLSRAGGATVNFIQPTGTANTTIAANNGFKTSTANDSTGIIGGWAVVTNSDGTLDWASNNGTNVVAYTGYADLAGAGPTISDNVSSNIRINSGSTGAIGQGGGTTTVNSIRVTDATARTITVGTGNTLRLGASGGILATGSGGLTIGASGNAGSLTAGGAGDTAGEIVLTNTTAVAINSVITNNGTGVVSLTKAGAGTLTLNTAATHTGGTTINAGTVILAAGNDTLLSTGNITLNAGTLNLGTTTQNLSGAFVMAGGTLSNGSVAKSGSDYEMRFGTVSAILGGSVGLTKSTFGTLSLDANNTYTGTTTILEGRLNATVAGAIDGNIVVGSPTGVNEASFAGSNLDVVANTASATIYRNGTFFLGNGDNMTAVTVEGGRFTSNNGYVNGSITMTGGTLSGAIFGNVGSFNSSASGETATIAASLSGGATTKTFTVADGAAAIDMAITGNVSSSAVTKSGAGVAALIGAKNYTGITTVSAGTLEVTALENGGANSSVGASASSAANLLLRNGTTLRYTGTGSTTDRLFTVGLSTGGTNGEFATIEASGTGAVVFTNTGNIAWGTANRSRTLRLGGTNTASNSLAATIADNGTQLISVEKNDAGKWVLTGTNTYTGTTTVNGGTFLVNGSLANTAVTVTQGTLGGTGAIGGAVMVEDGGVLAPGASIESLATGSVSLADGSALSMEINTSLVTSDLLSITGNFTIESGALLALSDLGSNQPLGSGTFTLVTYTGSWNGGLLTFNSSQLADGAVFSFGANGFMINYNDANALTLTVVPEPSALLFTVAGLGMLLVIRRRK